MTDIVERLRVIMREYDEVGWHDDVAEAAGEIEKLREELRRRYEMLEELRQENEQLKVSLVRICGMAHNDRRVMEVRPRDDVMPGAFIAKLKRPR